MNECLFFLHSFILIGVILITLRFGKTALSLLCTLFFLLSNLFVTKQIELFSFTVTACDAYTIGGVFALNLLQEYFGKEEAKKQTWRAAFILGVFVLLSQIHLLYTPSSYDQTQGAFSTILSTTPRIFFSSFITLFIVQRIDVEVFAFLRKRLPLPLTILASVALCQIVDTVLFSYLALYGLVHNIVHIILVSYLVKLIAILSMTPFTWRVGKAA